MPERSTSEKTVFLNASSSKVWAENRRGESSSSVGIQGPFGQVIMYPAGQKIVVHGQQAGSQGRMKSASGREKQGQYSSNADTKSSQCAADQA
jgi:hypothetical protein